MAFFKMVAIGTDSETNKAGILAVEAVLEEARRIAKTLAADKRTAIESLCNEIDSLKKELAMLQSSGQVGNKWNDSGGIGFAAAP